MSRTFLKEKDAVLDYTFDWETPTRQPDGTMRAWLDAGEAIFSATVTVPAGLTKVSQSIGSGTVTVWLSGGTVGQTYPVACRLTTSAGRTDERTMGIVVRER